MLAVALLPDADAVIVTGPPRATAVTTPAPFTLAIAGELLVHVNVAATGCPDAFHAVAVSVIVAPRVSVAFAGLTVTFATVPPVGAVSVIGTDLASITVRTPSCVRTNSTTATAAPGKSVPIPAPELAALSVWPERTQVNNGGKMPNGAPHCSNCAPAARRTAP